MFKTVQGNRQPDKYHLTKLVEAIEHKNLLAEFPIVINEHFEVIDGQHRLLAAAQLGLLVYYQTVKGLTLENVMTINTTSKSWSVKDFVLSHIELGNPNYAELLAFSEEYGLSLSTSAALLAGLGASGGNVSTAIRTGKFTVNTPGTAKSVAVLLNELAPMADFALKSDRKFAGALSILIHQDDFDSKRLAAKLRVHGKKIERRLNTRYYLLQLEEIYNHNAHDKVVLYRGQA
jgi:hypothetical protein